MVEIRWRPALPADLAIIAGWVETPAALERWAGPGLTWPADGATLWQQFDAGHQASFCLDSELTPVAFGQLVTKGEHHAHLARIIVSPAHRRSGLGERLCRHLLDEASRRRAAIVTLNVFADNRPALDLYRRLGFDDVGGVDSRGIQPMQLRQFAADVDNIVIE